MVSRRNRSDFCSVQFKFGRICEITNDVESKSEKTRRHGWPRNLARKAQKNITRATGHQIHEHRATEWQNGKWTLPSTWPCSFHIIASCCTAFSIFLKWRSLCAWSLAEAITSLRSVSRIFDALCLNPLKSHKRKHNETSDRTHEKEHVGNLRYVTENLIYVFYSVRVTSSAQRAANQKREKTHSTKALCVFTRELCVFTRGITSCCAGWYEFSMTDKTDFSWDPKFTLNCQLKQTVLLSMHQECQYPESIRT